MNHMGSTPERQLQGFSQNSKEKYTQAIAKRNYEIRTAREAKANPKVLLQLNKIKARDKIGSLKSGEALVDTDGEMNEVSEKKNYLLFLPKKCQTIYLKENKYTEEERQEDQPASTLVGRM